MAPKAARGPHGRAQAPAKRRPTGRGAHRRRGRRKPQKAGGARALANLATAIATAAWFARQFPAPVPPDAALCEKYRRAIEARCGVPVDDPELAQLVMVHAALARRRQFLEAASVYAPRLAALLKAQREQRHKFFVRHPTAAMALGVAPEDLPPRSVVGIATAYREWEDRGERLSAWLRGLPPPEGQRAGGRIADADLNATAAAVAALLRRRGRIDWTAIAEILLCYRFNLRERLGCSDPGAQARRLEDRVRKMRTQGNSAAS